MASLKKYMVVMLLSAAVLCPRISAAMEIQMFDDMAIQDQQDYLKVLVKRVETILNDQGRRELAAKVNFLFRAIPPGDHRSVGETQFEQNLAKMRAFVSEHNLKDAGRGRQRKTVLAEKTAAKKLIPNRWPPM